MSVSAMTVLAIPYPNFDPVAISIGPVSGYGPIDIKWYGLAYVAGLILGWLYIRRLLATPRLWHADTPPFVVHIAWLEITQIYLVAGALLMVAVVATMLLLRRMRIFEAVKLGEAV